MTEVRLDKETFDKLAECFWPDCAVTAGWFYKYGIKFILEEEKPSPLQNLGTEYREKCKTCGGKTWLNVCEAPKVCPDCKMEEPVPCPKVDESRLLGCTDAVVWSQEFDKVCPGIDSETMVTWFANAICAGYDSGYRCASGNIGTICQKAPDFEGNPKDCAFTGLDLANARLESAENHIKVLQDKVAELEDDRMLLLDSVAIIQSSLMSLINDFNKACEAGDKDIDSLKKSVASLNDRLDIQGLTDRNVIEWLSRLESEVDKLNRELPASQ